MSKISLTALITALVMLLFTSTVTEPSKASFLRLRQETQQPGVTLGDWNTPAHTAQAVEQHLEQIAPEITLPNGSTADISEYIRDIVFEGGDTAQISDAFTGYTVTELKEAVNNLSNFAQLFLTEENGEIVYRQPQGADTLLPDFGEGLAPGEYAFFPYLIWTAELAAIPYYSPFTLRIILGDGQTDISDFAVTVLFDQHLFVEDGAFSYDYLYADSISWNRWRAQEEVKIKQNNLPALSKTGPNTFETYVYKQNAQGNYVLNTLTHTFGYPGQTGEWCNVPIGAKLMLSEPRNSAYGYVPQFFPYGSGTRVGLSIPGRSDGRPWELRVDVPVRRPSEGNSLPLIPIAFVLTRAQGAPAPKYLPHVEIKFTKGNVWDVPEE